MSVFKVGQVVWHEGYKRYMRVHSIVYEGLSETHHSYIVPAWNTPGTIQVHADKVRALTAEEFGAPVEDSSSPQVTPPKYDPSWHGSQAHTFVTDKPVGSEVKPRTQPCKHGILPPWECKDCMYEEVTPRTGDKS